jgi:Rieske Fe-S protein
MNQPTAQTRRHFLKTFALTTVQAGVCAVGGKLFLAEVEAQSTGLAGIFRIDITQPPFTPLQNTSDGSVRVHVTGTQASFADIIITRVSAGEMFAVTARCTHIGLVQVQAYNSSSPANGSLFCTHLGSRFTPQGDVINGPAAAPLEQYDTAFDGSRFAQIQIPDLGYSVTQALVSAGGRNQVRLTFPTLSGISYQVVFRQRFSDSWQTVIFTTTQGGVPSLTTLSGTNTGATVFVDRTSGTGFYAITRF